MKNKFFIFLTSTIFIFFFTVLFLGLNKSNIYTPNQQLESKIENFEVTDFFNEDKIFLEDLLSGDHFYLINIWSSWCIPCQDEHRYLVKIKNETSIKLIGINYKDKQENAQKFLNEYKNPFDRILNDKNGTISINFGAYGVPETFLVKNKKIVKKIIGPINNKKYFNILKKINE